MKNGRSLTLGSVAALPILITLSGCVDDQYFVLYGQEEVLVTSAYDPNKTVCTPFGEGPVTAPDHGLIADLFYNPNGSQGGYSGVSQFLDQSDKIDVTLFFNVLNSPTRPWDRGFVTQSGQVLKTAAGDTLYEYFGLRLKSELRLTSGDMSGDYQFALLADDGAILSAEDLAGNSYVVADDDGIHPTKLGCASQTVHLDRDSSLPIEVQYFQGPRYHTSLILLWRERGASDSLSDPGCGTLGNGLFFDSTQDPPAPQQAYLNLLGRGWKVVAPENFFLPAQGMNPCLPP